MSKWLKAAGDMAEFTIKEFRIDKETSKTQLFIPGELVIETDPHKVNESYVYEDLFDMCKKYIEEHKGE